MFDVVEHNGRGGVVHHRLDQLPFADGKLAHTLDPADLYRRLAKLKVPDISAHTGRQDLLIVYSKFLRETQPEQILNGVWTPPVKAAPTMTRAEFLEMQKGRMPKGRNAGMTPNETLSAAGAIVALARIASDRTLVDELTKLHDAVLADQAKLSDLQTKAGQLRKERADFERERDATISVLATDRAALDTDRADLEKEKARHCDAVDKFAADRQQWDAKHKEFLRLRDVLGQPASAS